MLHDVKELDFDPSAKGYRMVVSGHSHKPSQTERAGVLYVNPGAAGPRRFRLPVTVARLDVRQWAVEFVELTASPSPRRQMRSRRYDATPARGEPSSHDQSLSGG